MASIKVAKTGEVWPGLMNRMAVQPTHSTAMTSSLLFDIDVDDEQLPAQRKCTHTCDLNSLSQRLAYFCRPHGNFALQLLPDLRTFKAAVLREENSLDAVVLATKLSNVGYIVNLRTALGGGGACFKNLRHEFLVVRGVGDFDQYEYIVEPQLRDHFEITHPSQTYLQVLQLVPEEFVGTVSSLTQVVQAVCAEMAASFAAQELTLPPWRRVDSILSKWMPTKSKDISMGSPYSYESPVRTCFGSKHSLKAAALHQVPQRLPGTGITVKPSSVPGLLPVYSVQFGFVPHVA